MSSRILYARWLMAPIFIGMGVIFPMLAFKFFQSIYHDCLSLVGESVNETIEHVLELIEISLTGGLGLVVMFSGYQNFVARICDRHDDRPTWMGQVKMGEIKLRLMASIVAISAIDLLQLFMNLSTTSNRVLGWSIGIHLALVGSAVLLAVVDRIVDPGRE